MEPAAGHADLWESDPVYRSDYRDQDYDDERERSWDDGRYGEFDSGFFSKGGTADYYADDSPERNRRQKKRAGLNTAGVSNSYDDEVAGPHEGIATATTTTPTTTPLPPDLRARNVILPQDTGSGTIITTSHLLHQEPLFCFSAPIRTEDTCPMTACGV